MPIDSSLLPFAVLVLVASGCGGVSGGPALGSAGASASVAQTPAGADAGGGEATAGDRSMGGDGATAGTVGNDCGLQFTVSSSAAANAAIADLVVTSPLLSLECTPTTVEGTCSWYCRSVGTSSASSNAITISAPGFQTMTVDFVNGATVSDGHSPSCPTISPVSVQLQPTCAAVATCCADLQNDPGNCGACGRTCAAGAACNAGKCEVNLSGCVGGAFVNCDDYCQRAGKKCSATCGPSGDIAAAFWLANSACSGVYDTTQSCSSLFANDPSPSGRLTYACCCK